MAIQLSSRVKNIKPSATLTLNALAGQLRSQGKDIISLSAGEPDFPTPEEIKQAAIDAIQENKTTYTPVDGISELKQAVISKFAKLGLHYNSEEIIISSGAKQSIYNLMQAILELGDEVIIPNPYWVSYPDMTILADATPKIVDTKEDGLKLTAEKLERAITPKTKLLILNSPSNPSGLLYTKAELSALAQVLLKHPNIVILSDDIYEDIIWQAGQFCNIVMAEPKLQDRTIVINGVSKSHCMTGWRIGYAAGPSAIIKAMKKIQSQSTSNPCSISQYAATKAVYSGNEYTQHMPKAFKERHDFAVAQLNKLDGVQCNQTDGSFYLFPNCTDLVKKLNMQDTAELAEFFLHNAEVVVVPGEAFGMSGHVRISIAVSKEVLQTAIERMQNAINKQVTQNTANFVKINEN